MSDSKQTLYMVAYWFFCDAESMIIEAFETPEEADKFEELVWDKCQDAHIECEVVKYIGKTKQYNDALLNLNSLIQEEKEFLNNEGV